jgi:hypothetical protein
MSGLLNDATEKIKAYVDKKNKCRYAVCGLYSRRRSKKYKNEVLKWAA